MKPFANNDFKFSLRLIPKEILKEIENTNIVSARTKNLSNSSLKTDDRSSGLFQTLKPFANNDFKFLLKIIPKEILKEIENTNIVSARAENLSNSSLKTDDRSSGLVQTLKQFGNNDELLMSR